MADTTVNSALKVERWDADYFAEYIRDSGFKPYMGTGTNSLISVREDLIGKAGYQINIPLVTRLTGLGVTGNSVLEGNEETLGNYNCAVPVDVLRNAVVVTLREEQFTEIGIRNAAKDQLKAWSMDMLRGGLGATAAESAGIIDHLGAVFNAGTYSLYSAASEATKDAWLAANSDRVLFGAAKSNNSSNDHSASLTNIDNTSDDLHQDIVALAKRMAKTASPHIRPLKVEGNREFFVMFCPSQSFRDLKSNLSTVHQNAEVRGESNPIFQDGDLIYDGVIIREIPEIGVIADVGNGGTVDVAPNYLCGSQALGLVYAMRPRTKTQETDYEFRRGVGIMEMRGIRKMNFNNVQHGVLTVYSAGEPDT